MYAYYTHVAIHGKKEWVKIYLMAVNGLVVQSENCCLWQIT